MCHCIFWPQEGSVYLSITTPAGCSIKTWVDVIVNIFMWVCVWAGELLWYLHPPHTSYTLIHSMHLHMYWIITRCFLCCVIPVHHCCHFANHWTPFVQLLEPLLHFETLRPLNHSLSQLGSLPKAPFSVQPTTLSPYIRGSQQTADIIKTWCLDTRWVIENEGFGEPNVSFSSFYTRVHSYWNTLSLCSCLSLLCSDNDTLSPSLSHTHARVRTDTDTHTHTVALQGGDWPRQTAEISDLFFLHRKIYSGLVHHLLLPLLYFVFTLVLSVPFTLSALLQDLYAKSVWHMSTVTVTNISTNCRFVLYYYWQTMIM